MMDRVELMVADGGFLDWGRKYAVRAYLGAEDVELSWLVFAMLADLLERGARELGWDRVGRWELKAADFQLSTNDWLVTFQVWPPVPDLNVW